MISFTARMLTVAAILYTECRICNAYSLTRVTSRFTATKATGHTIPFQTHHIKMQRNIFPNYLCEQNCRLPKTKTSLGLSSSIFPQDILSSLSSLKILRATIINTTLFLTLRPKLMKMLTPSGLLHAFVLGCGLWSTLGWRGWSVCVAYLLMGQVVTKIRFEEKEAAGISEGRGGRRGPENVWGSALTGLICAILSSQGDSFLGIKSDVYVLAFVSSIATKLSDTFASEIGKAYGKTTFLITTLRKVPPGTEGAVSAEGTAAAVLGGGLLSLYAWSIGLITLPGVGISTVAAFLGCNAESVIGATLQGKKGFSWMTNEVVNFFNTLIGAGLAFFFTKVFPSVV